MMLPPLLLITAVPPVVNCVPGAAYQSLLMPLFNVIPLASPIVPERFNPPVVDRFEPNVMLLSVALLEAISDPVIVLPLIVPAKEVLPLKAAVPPLRARVAPVARLVVPPPLASLSGLSVRFSCPTLLLMFALRLMLL